MKYEIGQVLHFEKDRFDQSLCFWEKTLLPALISVVNEYELLGLGEFDNKAYKNVVNRNIDAIKKKFINSIKSDSKKLGSVISTAFNNNEWIDKKFDSFIGVVNVFHQKVEISQQGTIIVPSLDFYDCKIVDGNPLIDEDFMKARFEIKINTESQLRFLEIMSQLKDSYDNAKAYMNEVGLNNLLLVGESNFNALSWENEDGNLYVDPFSILEINTQLHDS
jgi:hypothetical protein